MAGLPGGRRVHFFARREENATECWGIPVIGSKPKLAEVETSLGTPVDNKLRYGVRTLEDLGEIAACRALEDPLA